MHRSSQNTWFVNIILPFFVEKRGKISSDPYKEEDEDNVEGEKQNIIINDLYDLVIGMKNKKLVQRKIMEKDVTKRTSWVYRYIDVFYNVTGNKPIMLSGWYRCTFKNCKFWRHIELSGKGNNDIQRHLVNEHGDENLNQTKYQTNPLKNKEDNYNIVMQRQQFELLASALVKIGFQHGMVGTKTISRLLPKKQSHFVWENVIEKIEEKAKKSSRDSVAESDESK